MIKLIIFHNVMIKIKRSYILDSLHTTEIFQVFYCFNTDDFGIQLMKGQNSYLKKLAYHEKVL